MVARLTGGLLAELDDRDRKGLSRQISSDIIKHTRGSRPFRWTDERDPVLDVKMILLGRGNTKYTYPGRLVAVSKLS